MHPDHRPREEERDDPVAVAHGVDAVGGHGAEAQVARHRRPVDREGAAADRPRAQRQHRGFLGGDAQAGSVADQRPDMGERPVGGAHRLGSLQVGVPGHDQLLRPRREADQGATQLHHPIVQRGDRLHAPQAHVGGGLVVAGTARVQLPARVAHLLDQQPLHQGVDVLVLHRGWVRILQTRRNRHQAAVDVLPFLVADNPGPHQRSSPRAACAHVLAPEAEVHLQRAVEGHHLGRHPLGETPAPEPVSGAAGSYFGGVWHDSRRMREVRRWRGPSPGPPRRARRQHLLARPRPHPPQPSAPLSRPRSHLPPPGTRATG